MLDQIELLEEVNQQLKMNLDTLTKEYQKKFYDMDMELMLKTEQNKNFELVRKSLNDEVTHLTLQLQEKNKEFEKVNSEFKKFKAKKFE